MQEAESEKGHLMWTEWGGIHDSCWTFCPPGLNIWAHRQPDSSHFLTTRTLTMINSSDCRKTARAKTTFIWLPFWLMWIICMEKAEIPFINAGHGLCGGAWQHFSIHWIKIQLQMLSQRSRSAGPCPVSVCSPLKLRVSNINSFLLPGRGARMQLVGDSWSFSGTDPEQPFTSSNPFLSVLCRPSPPSAPRPLNIRCWTEGVGVEVVKTPRPTATCVKDVMLRPLGRFRGLSVSFYRVSLLLSHENNPAGQCCFFTEAKNQKPSATARKYCHDHIKAAADVLF